MQNDQGSCINATDNPDNMGWVNPVGARARR